MPITVELLGDNDDLRQALDESLELAEERARDIGEAINGAIEIEGGQNSLLELLGQNASGDAEGFSLELDDVNEVVRNAFDNLDADSLEGLAEPLDGILSQVFGSGFTSRIVSAFRLAGGPIGAILGTIVTQTLVDAQRREDQFEGQAERFAGRGRIDEEVRARLAQTFGDAPVGVEGAPIEGIARDNADEIAEFRIAFGELSGILTQEGSDRTEAGQRLIRSIDTLQEAFQSGEDFTGERQLFSTLADALNGRDVEPFAEQLNQVLSRASGTDDELSNVLERRDGLTLEDLNDRLEGATREEREQVVRLLITRFAEVVRADPTLRGAAQSRREQERSDSEFFGGLIANPFSDTIGADRRGGLFQEGFVERLDEFIDSNQELGTISEILDGNAKEDTQQSILQALRGDEAAAINSQEAARLFAGDFTERERLGQTDPNDARRELIQLLPEVIDDGFGGQEAVDEARRRRESLLPPIRPIDDATEKIDETNALLRRAQRRPNAWV